MEKKKKKKLTNNLLGIDKAVEKKRRALIALNKGRSLIYYKLMVVGNWDNFWKVVAV